MPYRLLLAVLLAYLSPNSFAGDIIIIPGAGLNDTSSTTPIGGNLGTTLGQQRLNVFQKAADTLETYLDISFEVTVDAAFVTSLECSSESAILGTAGPNHILIDFLNAPEGNTFYPVALGNNLSGQDALPNTADIEASFNARIDNNTNCLNGSDWYYGYDDPATTGDARYINDISFYSTVIHELLHGLGVLSFVDDEGALINGVVDGYSKYLFDNTTGLSWEDMSNSQRLSSAKNTSNLVWTGNSVNNSVAALALTDGINNGRVEMYAPAPYENGSSVSHFSKDATPNEIMEPKYTEFLTTPGLAQQVLQDIGWPMPIAANNAPILTMIGALSSLEDNSKVVSLSATDADSQTVNFSAHSDNSSITTLISGSILTLIPDNNYAGSANITVTANDGSGAENAIDSEVFVYTITPENDLPIFTNSASGSVQYSHPFNLDLTATDADLDTLTFALTTHNSEQVNASINNSTLTIQAINQFTGHSEIEVRVSDGTVTASQTINLTIYDDLSLISSAGNLNQNHSLTVTNNTFEFTLGGGDNNYNAEVVFDGQNITSSLLSFSAGKYYLAMPESGAFAGNYTITITDGKGNSADFMIQRSLTVSANIHELIANSCNQKIYIEGAPAGSILDLHINQGAGIVDLKIDHVNTTQVVAPNDASRFNRAVVNISVNNVSDIHPINISADSVILPAGSINLTTLPFHDVALTVTDSFGKGVSTSINIDDDRFISWGLNQQQLTNDLGELLLGLPKDQTASLTLTAENFQSKTVALNPQLDQVLYALELFENPITVSGSITTSNLDFVSEAPLVQLIDSDGTAVIAEVSILNSNTVTYSVTINKFAFDANKLIVTYGDIIQEASISDNQIDNTLNVHIDRLQVSDELESSESIIKTSTSAGSGLMLLLSLLLLVNQRSKKY
ncbi:Protease-associated PA [Oleispira antarctica RB-8]|uniref:Protease-associated PA n=1 Tax=Oleispira antarctica RB-8 TaxID=698738 RepID=R4YPS9_OLEAN|nr:Protease-associated PA [Oleispira antarctica RB-8]